MPVFNPFTGMPGVSSEKIAKHRSVGADGYFDFLPGGVILDGTKTRDPDNPDYTTDSTAQTRLRAGLLIGKISSTSKYTNSFLGYLGSAAANGATTLTLNAGQEVTETLRRIGSTGTITLTGPATANGTVRTANVAFSAGNASNSTLTITSISVNEVQTANFTNSPAGNFTLRITNPVTGDVINTGPITYSATPATLVTNINTATDAAVGSGNIVASGSAVTAIALTGTGATYGNTPLSLIAVDVAGFTAGNVKITRTTTGVDGRFVAGSLIGDTDGSHLPVSFLPDGWEIPMPGDNTSDMPLSQVPIAGNVLATNLLPWPSTDLSLKAWIRTYLNTYGKFVFTENYA